MIRLQFCVTRIFLGSLWNGVFSISLEKIQKIPFEIPFSNEGS